MSAKKQYSDAKKALDIIAREVLSPGEYITYGQLATYLGHEPGKYARHIGQVCSLIDSACYWTKLPMLSLEKVRMDNGDRNPDSFGAEFFAIKNDLIANAAAHHWISDDVGRIKHTLDSHMNDESALLQWTRISTFGQAAMDRIASYK